MLPSYNVATKSRACGEGCGSNISIDRRLRAASGLLQCVQPALQCYQGPNVSFVVPLRRNIQVNQILRFLLMWTILKVFIEIVITLLLFYILAFWPGGMWEA